MAKVFFSYSHADEALRDQLEKQLAVLKRQGALEVWHDRRIGAGQNFAREIDSHLEEADVIPLLVSADFLASDYCYEREMDRALERHEEGTAIVIPVILRACAWHDAPFGKLLATPPDGRPVMQWPDRDQAFLEVTKAIKDAVHRLGSKSAFVRTHSPAPNNSLATEVEGPRSSNLRLAKKFSDHEKDKFRHDGFEYISKFFENSLAELESRNSGVQTSFRRIDANRFIAAVYKNGAVVSRCTVYVGSGHFGGGIAYIASETMESNSYNESLRVEADDQVLNFRSSGMARFGANKEEKLTMEGAAELYWAMLIERLQ